MRPSNFRMLLMYQQISSGNSKTKEYILLPNEIPLEEAINNNNNTNNNTNYCKQINKLSTSNSNSTTNNNNESIEIINNIKTVKLIDKQSNYIRLGFGGFGDVFLGTIEDKLKVAVKVTNLNKKNRIAFAKREARLLSKLNNKNIVTFYGCFRDAYNYYLVTEYCTQGVSSNYNL